MNPHPRSKAIPLTRVAALLRYIRVLEAMGAPIDGLLARAGIPASLLEHPAAVLSLEKAYRFGELACTTQGTEHLGLLVALESSIGDLGVYGQMLEESLTVHDYLRKGISLYNMLITGQHLWISEHGEELRFNIASIGRPRLSTYLSQTETLVVTLGVLREAAGPEWFPGEIHLAYKTREPLPDIELFSGSRIFRGTGETYFTLPRELMRLRLWGGRRATARDLELPIWDPLPQDMAGLVRLQTECLLSARHLGIDIIAESLAMSKRSLQRGLARQGLSYSQILAQVRTQQAAHWLENTDKPISEIAVDLCYTDASNFTRAFRSETGLSPRSFRAKAAKT